MKVQIGAETKVSTPIFLYADFRSQNNVEEVIVR